MPAASGSAVDRRLEQRASSLDRIHRVRTHESLETFPLLPISLEYLDLASAVIDR